MQMPKCNSESSFKGKGEIEMEDNLSNFSFCRMLIALETLMFEEF